MGLLPFGGTSVLPGVNKFEHLLWKLWGDNDIDEGERWQKMAEVVAGDERMWSSVRTGFSDLTN